MEGPSVGELHMIPVGPADADPARSRSGTPAAAWEEGSARRALDELFHFTHQYRTSRSYWELLRFIVRFRTYSPFNAMLVRIQMPGARFVATPSRWLRDHERRIKASARPLVVLRPMGPVMFVFDVSDTEPVEGAPPLPHEVEQPFEVRGGRITRELEQLIQNSGRDGVAVEGHQTGSQAAGSTRHVQGGGALRFPKRFRPNPEYVAVPHRYDVLINSRLSKEGRFATLVHELAHLYCGHLGTPDPRLWPDRRGLSHIVQEFEAESVCFLVCRRFGIDNPSEEYLAGYTDNNTETPPISLESVMKSAGLIEQMARERLAPRKETR